MDTSDWVTIGVSLFGMVVTIFGVVVAIYLSNRDIKSDLKGNIGAVQTGLIGEIGSLRQESEAAHGNIRSNINALDLKFTARFDDIERRDRRRLRALLDD